MTALVRRLLGMRGLKKNAPMRLHLLPARTQVRGLKPTLDELPHHNMVAINILDDSIYRNVNGTITQYDPVKDE